MARDRLSMRKTREILRQKWLLVQSHRSVMRSLAVGLGTVSGTVARAKAAGLTWALVEGLSETELEARLYRRKPGPSGERAQPDCAALHTELRRSGVTLQLLHVEYLERNPNGYGYTQFCHYYKQWLGRQKVSMRQVHRAGEKLFVDYAGKKPQLVDAQTGECREVELFVAVLGASSFTYAEATETQRVADFLESHVRALAYFAGAPAVWVPDQLKTGVTLACRYEPGIQRSYEELAAHYGAVVCRRVRASRATRPRSRWRYRWWSAGSWRGCATRPSSRSRPSIAGSASCSRISTTGGCGPTGPAGGSSTPASTGRR